MSVTKLDLKSSVCTDSPTGSDLFPFSADPTQVIQNTGIERNGGVAAIYEQQTTFTTAGAPTVIAKDGTVVQVDSSNNVRLNDLVIGNVGTKAVYARGVLPNYLDVAWTADNTVLGISRSGFTLKLDEYDPFNATITHTRTITFGSFGVSTAIQGISFVRYVDMHYADNQEFLVSPGIGYRSTFLQESGTTIATLGTGIYANFAHRFASGTTSYVWGLQAPPSAVVSRWATGTIAGGGASLSGASGAIGNYLIIDRFVGTQYSRAILTYPLQPISSSTIAAGMSYFGYTAAGTFVSSWTANGISIGTTTTTATLSNAISGFGYSECSYQLSTALSSMTSYFVPVPAFANTTNGYYGTLTSAGTTIPPARNAYGKLSGMYGNETFLVQWRSCFVSGVGAFLSAAEIPTSGTNIDDNLGVPITALGEWDDTYSPHIVDDNSTYSRIIYRYNGQFFFVDIRIGNHTINSLGDNSFLVNTLSPISCINMTIKQLTTGPNDYNGRVSWYGLGATQTTSKYAGVIQGSNINSIDPGDIVTSVVPSSIIGSPQVIIYGLPFGINLPSFIDRTPSDFGVNIFYNDLYAGTVLSGVGYSIAGLPTVYDIAYISSLSDEGYVPDTRIPFPQGYTISNRTVQTGVETFLLGVGVIGSADIDYDYAGYETGNDLTGTFQSFVLYGQTYLFDGNSIWLATFNGSLFNGRGNAPIAPATGMSLIAVSPIEAYFLSSFDNSIYVFNGGRALQKMKRLNDEETISNGVYNVRDNTLLLNATNHFIWIRDGIVTVNAKKANQTSISLYDTQNGIQIANNTIKWLYSYSSLSSSTVVPLTWQSAYHALQANETSELINWIVTVYSPDGRIFAPLTLTCHSFDQEKYNKQAAQSITINPGDWDGLGFYRARIQPQNRKALASSLQIDTTKHLVITDVSVEYSDQGKAAIAPARSK